MRKAYPKVPHYYHDSVSEAFFGADDLVLLEKMDGSNLRLCLYDERYADQYGDQLHDDYDPEDGDVFIASKNVIRGRLSDEPSDFDGNFTRLLTSLRETIDPEELFDLHEAHDSALLLFGEHMVKHTLDYGYETSPPPAFLGFDVFRLADYEAPPENPFDERFDGFLSFGDAVDVFEQVGLDTAPVVERPDSLDPDNVSIPVSSYGSLRAEGVVIRSDSRNRRVKYVAEEFRERMKEAWGMREDEAESGSELFSARYLTNARIRKHIHKLAQRQGDIDTAELTEAVVADAWEEELYDIRDIGIGLCPQDVYSVAGDRCREVLETMQTNAQLNDSSLDELWADFSEDDVTIEALETDTDALSAVASRAREADDTHEALVRAFVAESDIHETAESIAADEDQDIGRWVVQDVYDTLRDDLWFENLDVIANLPFVFVPADLNDALMEYVTEAVEARDDVEIDEKPEDWQPSVDDADASNLGSLF